MKSGFKLLKKTITDLSSEPRLKCNVKWELYLHLTVGDWAGDAILVSDVVGAVVGWARARAWCTVTSWFFKKKKMDTRSNQNGRNTICNSLQQAALSLLFLGLLIESLTCHVQRAFLGRSYRAVPPPQQRAAPPLCHLLLQPGAQFKIRLWRCGESKHILCSHCSLSYHAQILSSFIHIIWY